MRINCCHTGDSVMMAMPPAILDLLHLGAGDRVSLAVDNGRLVVEPQAKPRYTLDELFDQCDASADFTAEDREWLEDRLVGRELLR